MDFITFFVSDKHTIIYTNALKLWICTFKLLTPLWRVCHLAVFTRKQKFKASCM